VTKENPVSTSAVVRANSTVAAWPESRCQAQHGAGAE
jgi:hypothetical protein